MKDHTSTSKPCPIVIIHRGYSWYLPYTLWQARRYNPGAPVILVTDQNRFFLKLIARTVPLGEHMREAETFAKTYVHLSHNLHDFELFCFQRWFVLQSVMAALNLNNCFYLDTDVLLYTDINAVHPVYSQAEITINYEQGPFSTFINSRDALRDFCQHIQHLFTHEVASMTAAFESWKASGSDGGISDMHALKEYVRASKIRVIDTADIINNAAFNTVIHQSNGYRMKDGIIDLEWEQGLPYARLLESGKRIRFHSLHLQGNSKGLILSLNTLARWPRLLIRLYNRLLG